MGAVQQGIEALDLRAVLASLVLTPIGVIHTPYVEKRSAPRQPAASAGARGRIELSPDPRFEHALEDLSGFSHVWLIFGFHENRGWRPKVLAPRSTRRRGVFATRSPHRPNPLGLSLVELESIERLTLHVRNVDMLDGSPLFDIKPYVPYADHAARARTGWLEAYESPHASELSPDPLPAFDVCFTPEAAAALEFLREHHAVDLRASIEKTLALGPQPHPYRRIKRTVQGLRLAIKDWRAYFAVHERRVTVLSIASGYRREQLARSDRAELEVHRAFAARFPEEIAAAAASE